MSNRRFSWIPTLEIRTPTIQRLDRFCTLISKDESSYISSGMFGHRHVEFIYGKQLSPLDFDGQMFQQIAAIINNTINRPYKVNKFNKILNTKVTIIALDGFISQGKTTDLNNIIAAGGAIKPYEYFIREQDSEWRAERFGQKNYMMKNHQNLLIFSLLADIYQIYIRQGNI